MIESDLSAHADAAPYAVFSDVADVAVVSDVANAADAAGAAHRSEVPEAAGPAGAAAVRERRPAARLLHVLNGDSVVAGLRAAGIAGDVTLSADVLYEGPVQPGNPERCRRARARFLAECGYDGYDECLARLTSWDRALADFRAHDEVVLWFEHDLFDQLHLCRLLAWFAARDTGLTDLSLVQASDYLGRMPPEQLAALFAARRPVAETQLRLADAAWRAFCAPEPAGLESLLRADTAALPHLAAALGRHLEEFPGIGDGLSRSERQALAALAATGGRPLPFAALFAAVQGLEERVFMTDLSLLRRLRDLAAGPRPLLRLHPPAGPWSSAAHNPLVSLTAAGRAVFAGEEDWIAIRGGIDLWLGGVHLHGPRAAWRWDPATRRLRSLQPSPPSAAAPSPETLEP
ncbi:MAG: DUF1835 domain-containing protein [Acidobacteria bacterium]|nr:DUF1835 domain-containing protein [Acidobacteriota bacterium]